MYGKKRGFTLVEVMIVVMIIGLLAAMSYPSYKKSRDSAQQTVCINNLRILQHAADRKIMRHPDTTALTPADLDDYYKNRPECPAGGTYSINIVDGDAEAVCDFGSGHEL